MVREQGDSKKDLESTKIILGSIKKIIQGGRRKGPNVKGSRELGTRPYGVSIYWYTTMAKWLSSYKKLLCESA